MIEEGRQKIRKQQKRYGGEEAGTVLTMRECVGGRWAPLKYCRLVGQARGSGALTKGGRQEEN